MPTLVTRTKSRQLHELLDNISELVNQLSDRSIDWKEAKNKIKNLDNEIANTSYIFIENKMM